LLLPAGPEGGWGVARPEETKGGWAKMGLLARMKKRGFSYILLGF